MTVETTRRPAAVVSRGPSLRPPTVASRGRVEAAERRIEYVIYGIPKVGNVTALGVSEFRPGATLSAQLTDWFRDHAYFGRNGDGWVRLLAVEADAVAFL